MVIWPYHVGYYFQLLSLSKTIPCPVDRDDTVPLKSKILIQQIAIIHCSESKLQKEHDIAVSKLSDRQRKFQARLHDILEIVKGFKTKDRMSEAQDYLLKLHEIQRVMDEFYNEVSQ